MIKFDMKKIGIKKVRFSRLNLTKHHPKFKIQTMIHSSTCTMATCKVLLIWF